MSTLTPELNLVQVQDDDDTADYLVQTNGLAGSLAIIDGLFNASTGHVHGGAHQGGTLTANSYADNTLPGAKLVDGSVTAAKLAANIIEALFAGTTTVQSANYGVTGAVMFVFCTAAITVTLPGISINRPITVAATNGQVTVAAVSGSVIGGSVNTSTGAVMNGICSSGDGLTFKSDGTNWRVI